MEVKSQKKHVAINNHLLVRYLMGDSEESEYAKMYFEDVLAGRENCYIPQIILFKTIYILEDVYKVERHKIAKVISYLLQSKHVVTPDKNYILKALELYAKDKEKKLDLIDCYLWALHKNKMEVYFGRDAHSRLSSFFGTRKF